MILKYEIELNNNIITEELLNACLLEEEIGGMETSVINNIERHFIYLEDNDLKNIKLKKIREILKKLRIETEVKFVEKIDGSYLTKYKESLKPVLIDNILIKPSWCNVKIIEIDPQTAFGTGQHETTKLAVQALLKCTEKCDSILDVGTGSGILSIVANYLKIRYIFSFDNDIEAVKVAKENFLKNNFSDYNLFAGTFEAVKGKNTFDIVVANIISSILLQLKDFLKKSVKNNGYLILSGILKEELENFKQEFDFNSFNLRNEFFLNEWSCLIYQKRSINENQNQ
jgi:ribosomal protein L11 methyltransferase